MDSIGLKGIVNLLSGNPDLILHGYPTDIKLAYIHVECNHNLS